MKESNSKSEGLKLLGVLGFMFIGAFIMFLYIRNISGSKYVSYGQNPVNGRVQKITGFGRGFPTVVINNKEITLLAPDAFGKYLMVGDSVMKQIGNRNIAIFRDSANGIQATHWEYVNTNGYEQIETTRHYSKLK